MCRIIQAAAVAVLMAVAGLPLSLPAAAQDNDPALQALRTDNPHIKIVEDKARALVAPLSQPQMQSLFTMREGYGLIRSVEIVRRDIGRAVNLCGKDNPGLKKPMDERFKSWSDNVTPVLEERMATLQTAIDMQNFASPARIRDYFKALDDAAAYAERQFDKRVITTAEACQSLLDSMHDTEANVVSIMKELRVPKFNNTDSAAEE